MSRRRRDIINRPTDVSTAAFWVPEWSLAQPIDLSSETETKPELNPYYDAEKLGLDLVVYNQHIGYEYNMLIFVRPKDTVNRVYSAWDAGCSCPIPFDQYRGTTQEEVLQKMERVPSLQAAQEIYWDWRERGNPKEGEFDSWNGWYLADWFTR